MGAPNIATNVPVKTADDPPSNILPQTNNASPGTAAIMIPQNIPDSVTHSGLSNDIILGNQTAARSTAKNRNNHTNCMPGMFAINIPDIANVAIPNLA